jgi:VanZ family protein
MGLVNNYKRNKKIKALKSRNVITSDWSDFLKNYPLVSVKLNSDKEEELKTFIRPSTKIKIYFNSSNITFYLIGVSGKEDKIANNVIFNSWDEVSMEELDEFIG